MPATLPKDILERADAAVVYAQQVRRWHRRRKKPSATRNADLQRARDRITEAIAPIRSEIGRFPYGPDTDIAERNRQSIRDASQSLQVERRKLTKMMQARISQEPTE